jgi:hypothetical protein
VYDHTNNLLELRAGNNTQRLNINGSTGGIRFLAYGAGTLTTDASGNISASAEAWKQSKI